MLRTPEPEIAGEQGIKLGRDETHFGCQLHALLAQVKEVVAELFVEENHGFGSERAVLCSSERKNIDTKVACGLSQDLSQAGGGICDPGPIHVQEHASFVG